jgi:hypothetical protein
VRRRARYEREKASRPRATPPATSYEQLRPATSAARIAELEARLARTKGAVAVHEITEELGKLRELLAIMERDEPRPPDS